MHNFKIGDTVKRIKADNYYLGLQYGDVGIVVGFEDNWPLLEGYGNWMHDPNGLELVHRDATYDELPPAPESVQYFNSHRDEDNDQRLVPQHHPDYQGHLSFGIVRKGQRAVSLSINLDADAALQLCHDLRRMAMELKRKEK